MDRKLKLADCLKEELERLKDRIGYTTKSLVVMDYKLSINYLQTNNKPLNWDEYDLLYACVEDLETLYSDYDIN